MVKEQLGLKTALGVSISALTAPSSDHQQDVFNDGDGMRSGSTYHKTLTGEDMMASIFAFHVLHNIDENATAFIERYGDAALETSKISQKKDTAVTGSSANGDGKS